MRYIFSKNGGKLGTSGSVAYLFERKAGILPPRDSIDEDELIELALEAGAEDVEMTESDYRVVTAPTASWRCATLCARRASPSRTPRSQCNPRTASSSTPRLPVRLRLMDALEENDVQEVYANFDISEEVMAEVATAWPRRRRPVTTSAPLR